MATLQNKTIYDKFEFSIANGKKRLNGILWGFKKL